MAVGIGSGVSVGSGSEVFVDAGSGMLVAVGVAVGGGVSVGVWVLVGEGVIDGVCVTVGVFVGNGVLVIVGVLVVVPVGGTGVAVNVGPVAVGTAATCFGFGGDMIAPMIESTNTAPKTISVHLTTRKKQPFIYKSFRASFSYLLTIAPKLPRNNLLLACFVVGLFYTDMLQHKNRQLYDWRYQTRLNNWLHKLHTLRCGGMSWEDITAWSKRRFQPGHEHERV